jgi:ubiquinol-cytochrome c reductase cytochrome c1 subunit
MKFKRVMTALAGLVLSGSSLAAGGGAALEHANVNVFDNAAVQRGARLYVDYCSGCHSAQYMRYKRLSEDLGYSEEEILANLAKPGSKIGDPMTSALSKTDGAKLFGVPPPDLTLIARVRGDDWLYSYLKSFYRDESRSMGWNNTVFPNASMPNVLWELQGVQKLVTKTETGHDGETHEVPAGFETIQAGSMSGEEFDNSVRDLVTFLQYLGEPGQIQRRELGVWVILFLVLFTFLAYLMKLEYWKDVKK